MLPKLAKNVLGKPLRVCSMDPVTGFFRTGCCETSEDDLGIHTICVVVTTDFLTFSKQMGNDLSTPRPEFDFTGLQDGDRWCLCLPRWIEAKDAGMAPKVVLGATHESVLDFVDLEELRPFAIDNVTHP
ncbi:MAG: DUF2237 family protein [Candidatus Margulisiibacteriota bacterium]